MFWGHHERWFEQLGAMKLSQSMRYLRATATSLALLVVLPSARAQTYDFSAVNLIAVNAPIVFPPGTQLAYEGDGMQVVGRICEIVTDKDWHTIVRDELVNAAVDGGGIGPLDPPRAVDFMLATMEGIKVQAICELDSCQPGEAKAIVANLKRTLGFPGVPLAQQTIPKSMPNPGALRRSRPSARKVLQPQV
jgi:hypothetical protein